MRKNQQRQYKERSRSLGEKLVECCIVDAKGRNHSKKKVILMKVKGSKACEWTAILSNMES